MPTVIFEPLASGSTLTVNKPEGGALIDICDDARAPIPFSCRSASCGTCRIDILEGAELLDPPEEDELDLLDIFGDHPPKRRLACCANVRPNEGHLRIRSVDDA